MRLHVRWGNYEGPHDRDVPLRDILPSILQANVGAIFLPFANPRHAHEYAVLKSIPLKSDQLLIAGVIDTLTNFVEHPEVVANRIGEAAAAVGDPSARARRDGLRLRHIRPAWAASRRTWSGPSSARCATARGSHRNGCFWPEPRRQGVAIGT